jgi:glycosyltransferase involved in cell wall biosynthesis
MITAQSDRPLEPPRSQESVYDLFRSCLANQTYQGPLEVIVADANPDRLAREHAAGSWERADRVVFTKQVQHDRIAISGARNTAGAYARGDLIVFVDDCTELLPSFLEAAVDLHAQGKIPTRVYLHSSRERLPQGKIPTRELLRSGKFDCVDPVWRNQGCPTDLTEWTLSGNACGVFAMPREVFLRLNGFDENFDGNWGCEDCEFWTRFDRLKLRRVGRADLAVIRWAHQSTPSLKTLRRCREAYAQWSYRSSRVVANRRLSDEVIDELKRAPFCNSIVGGSTCGLCSAPDRDQQIDTYRTFPADFDLRAIHAIYSVRPSGIYTDPWR